MKKVLITGGAGFIGLSLAKKLATDGFEIHLVDNFSRGVKDIELEQLQTQFKVILHQIDLRNANSVDQLAKDFDYIYHLAAIVGVANVLERPYQVLTDNVMLLHKVLLFAKAQKQLSRFVFTSTSEVYAGTLEKYGLEVPTPEATALTLPDLSKARPSYLLSKIYGEAMCQHAGVPYTIVRPHNFYGPRMGMSHVIPELLAKAHKARDGDALPVYSVSHKRTFCFIDDAIEMITLLTLNPEANARVFNIGNESPEISMQDLALLIAEVVGKKLTIQALNDTPGSPLRRAPLTKLARSLTNYTPQVSLSDGIARTYSWYCKHFFRS